MENRTKVIEHFIENSGRYKWSFDIHTNSFETFIDNTQFIVKNYGETALYEYDIVFVVKSGKRCLLVQRDNEILLRDLWIKLYYNYVSTTSDYYWEKVYNELLEPKYK